MVARAQASAVAWVGPLVSSSSISDVAIRFLRRPVASATSQNFSVTSAKNSLCHTIHAHKQTHIHNSVMTELEMQLC